MADFPGLVSRDFPPCTKMIPGFAALSSLLIISKHHDNIRRLLTRTEPRFHWRKG